VRIERGADHFEVSRAPFSACHFSACLVEPACSED
jgi:hypothetical protein